FGGGGHLPAVARRARPRRRHGLGLHSRSRRGRPRPGRPGRMAADRLFLSRLPRRLLGRAGAGAGGLGAPDLARRPHREALRWADAIIGGEPFRATPRPQNITTAWCACWATR